MTSREHGFPPRICGYCGKRFPRLGDSFDTDPEHRLYPVGEFR